MKSAPRLPAAAHIWPRARLLRALLLGAALSFPACGTLGIDLEGSDSSVIDGLGGDGPHGVGGVDTTEPSSGGTSTSSGGHGVGDETGSGGQAGSGGKTSSGGTGGEAAGGTAGAGGGSGGTSGDGGTAGTGGAGADCDANDEVCTALVAALTNRYSFNGIGPAIVDAVGGKNGTAQGTALDGTGELDFSGLNDQVSLPDGLISTLPNATIEVWFEWDGGEQWQWLFAFGHQTMFANPTSYLYATPEAGGGMPAQNALAAGLRHEDTGDRQLRTTEFTMTGVLTQIVLVANDTADRLSLYKNGAWIADRDTDVHLGGIDDDTNFLGRSLFPDDPDFDGRITEFRIYGEALTAEMIEKSYVLGPDTTFAP